MLHTDEQFFSSSPQRLDFRLTPPGRDDDTEGQTDAPPINELMLALPSCFAQPKSTVRCSKQD